MSVPIFKRIGEYEGEFSKNLVDLTWNAYSICWYHSGETIFWSNNRLYIYIFVLYFTETGKVNLQLTVKE